MISIIGGGPAGLRTAELLAKEGFNVGVFEQKKKIGAPVQCTGIVTSAINEVLEIPNKIIVNRINKIIVHSENSEMRLNLKSPDIILNREKFDCFLAENAEKNGAKIFLENKFIKKENEKIIIKELKTNKIKEIKTDILVGADGPLSEVYSIINPGIKRIFYKGIQVRAKGKFEKNSFLVYLGKVCPGFFAWVVGENEGVARIGLASMSSQANLLRNFLEKSGIKNKDIIETQAGLIPIYNPKVKVQKNNVYLIGDAAGQIKSTTGGGIVQDMLAAKVLCDSIANKKNYEKEERKAIGRELWIHLKLRHALNRFSDRDFDNLVKIANKETIKRILGESTRDAPSRFMLKLFFAEPRLALFARKFI